MQENNSTKITIETSIEAPIEKIWIYWTEGEHVTKWNTASKDWHTTRAENDFVIGGKFIYRMEAKDGSFGFDFGGVYDDIKLHKFISYTLGDGRKVEITFKECDDVVNIVETFDAESENPPEMQKQGWQSILDNFKKYVLEA